MLLRCLGWGNNPLHAPMILGEKAPLDDKTISDGMCSRCEARMIEEEKADSVCGRCGGAESVVYDIAEMRNLCLLCRRDSARVEAAAYRIDDEDRSEPVYFDGDRAFEEYREAALGF